MIAISMTGLEADAMNKEEGRKEIIYQMTMAAAKKMLEEGLITKEQYEQFDTVMRQKYEPVFGDLFTNINLL